MGAGSQGVQFGRRGVRAAVLRFATRTRRPIAALVAVGTFAPLLFGLVLTPTAGGVIVDNGRIHFETGDALGPWGSAAFFPRFGPGIIHLWYPDWYPGAGANLPGDVMWYGTYDYIGAAPAGTTDLDFWKAPDSPSNGTVESEPGPGKWADDHASTPLDGGVSSVIDPVTFEIAWSETRTVGANFDAVLNYHALPNQRTIRVIATVTNTHPTQAFDFAYYHSEDVDAAGQPFSNNNVDNDNPVNDALDDTPPFDQSNQADDGAGDPGDTWDEQVVPYTGVNWPSTWPSAALTTSGWKGPGVGYMTVTDAGGQDICDQTVTPANCGGAPDGRPDLYSGLSSFDPGVDWYVGRWDAAAYGPGLYQSSFTYGYNPLDDQYLCIDAFPGPPGPGYNLAYATYWTWEDIWECDQTYQDTPNHTLVDEDIGVGLLKHFGTIPAQASQSFTFYIGEPPVGADITISNGDLSAWPDSGSTYAGNTILLNATVHSGGTIDVASDFPVTFFKEDPDANNDGIVDAGAQLIGSATVNAGSSPIAPGATRTVTFSWMTTPADIDQFTIFAVADYQVAGPFADGAVDEVNLPFYEITNNKAFYDTASVPGGPGPPYRTATPPDYEIHATWANLRIDNGNITVWPDFGSTWVGSTVWLNATMLNDGVAPIVNPFPVTFYRGDPDADNDGIIDASVLALGSTTVPASAGSPMNPGETRTVSVAWAPLLFDAGQFTIYAAVDLQAAGPFVDGAVDERNAPAYEILDNKAFYDTAGYPGGIAPPFVTATPPDYEVHVPPTPWPPRNVRTQEVAGDVLVTWDPPLVGVADYYEVYRGPTPRGIDLLTPHATTAGPITSFLDGGAASAPGEQYYLVRAVNSTIGARSATSNTAGAFIVSLGSGWNALSLPLQPFSPLDVAGLQADLGATSVNYMDASGAWIMYPGGPNVPVAVGLGYQADIPAAGLHTFVGFPGAMIRYGGPGFTATEATSLAATVTPAGDVDLTWTQPASPVSYYCVERSDTRDGFHTGLSFVVGCTTFGDPTETFMTDFGGASSAGERFYLVSPVVPAAGNGTYGSSAYSLGVFTADYAGTHAIGPPLKAPPVAVSWLTDNLPALGILWPSGPVWVPHFAAMPAGVYDAWYQQAVGYQLQVQVPVRFFFVGT